MEAYLDNSATTRVAREVQELMVQVMDRDYGNPSSMHRKGMEAERYVREAADRISGILKCKPKELIFTSGGTESNNMALIGTALAARRAGKHIVTTVLEHASVTAPLQFLREEGFEITQLPADGKGTVRLEELKAALRPDTILVSVMYVNNEIGTIQPVEEIAKLVHTACPKAVFHVDAIQAFGKLPIRPKRQGIDLLSVSSHKFHGPKGVGFLYCGEQVHLHPIIFGGGQQRDMRSGTENVPGIAGMGLAAELAYRDLAGKQEHMNRLRRHFLEGIHQLEGLSVNGWDETADGDAAVEKRAAHIVSVSVQGVRSEVLLHALEDRGVYVSAGSACSSNHPAVSRTLKAVGVPGDLLESTVRFSFCPETTMAEIDYALEALGSVLPVLRRFVRK